MIKNRLISLSEKIAESLNRFAAEGHLIFWSDMFSAGVSMPGVIFYKVCTSDLTRLALFADYCIRPAAYSLRQSWIAS